MTKLSLGARLAANNAEAEAQTRAWAEKAAAAKSAEELAKFEAVANLFDEAQIFFTDGILAGKTVKSLRLQVGQAAIGDSKYMAAYNALGMYSWYQKKEDSYITKPSPYFCLWRDFKAWAAENDLEAYWIYRYDGGGVHSWFELAVRPVKSVVLGKA